MKLRRLVQHYDINNKKAVLSQGNCAMPQLFFSVKSSPTTFTTSLMPGLETKDKPGINYSEIRGYSQVYPRVNPSTGSRGQIDHIPYKFFIIKNGFNLYIDQISRLLIFIYCLQSGTLILCSGR